MIRKAPTMRRISSALSAAAIVAGAFVVLAAPPAAAFQKPTFTIKQGKQAVTHGGIPGNYPGGTAAIPTPPGCGNANNTAAFQGSCDRIPIKIEVPEGLGPTDDFFLKLVVTWEPSDEVDQVGAVNDLDIYFWDNQQIGKRTNKNSTSYTRLATSAGGHQPEKINLFSPDLGDYNLTIINWAGPNISYTITAELTVEGFEAPFEDLGPSFSARNRQPRGDTDETDSFVAPVDLSGDEPPGSGGAGGSGAGDAFGDLGGATAAPTLDEVPVLPDSDFTSVGNGTGNSPLAAPPDAFGSGRSRLAAVAGPVSPIVLVFWLVLVPLALMAGAVFLMMRRNRDAFAFST